MITHVHDSHNGRYYLTRQASGGFWHLQGPGVGPGVCLHRYQLSAAHAARWTHPLDRDVVFAHWQECINAYLERVLPPVEAPP